MAANGRLAARKVEETDYRYIPGSMHRWVALISHFGYNDVRTTVLENRALGRKTIPIRKVCMSVFFFFVFVFILVLVLVGNIFVVVFFFFDMLCNY